MASQLEIPGVAAEDGLARLRALPTHLATQIRGQGHVLPRITSVFLRGELGLAPPGRPRGSLLLVGPTGVGKTETTNVSAHYLFGAPPIRFDMSEYQLQTSVGKLIGEARDDIGLLGRALRSVARGVLLFDEVEKAHPLVLDLFLQMLWDGRITLATGEVVDLGPFYVVLTSNIGSADSMRMENAPFASIERTVLMRVREQLRPELMGRVTEILVFNRLDYETQRRICADLIATEVARLAALGHVLRPEPRVLEFLVRLGHHRMLGARPMRAAVERCLQEAVTAARLAGEGTSGVLTVALAGQGLAIRSGEAENMSRVG